MRGAPCVTVTKRELRAASVCKPRHLWPVSTCVLRFELSGFGLWSAE